MILAVEAQDQASAGPGRQHDDVARLHGPAAAQNTSPHGNHSAHLGLAGVGLGRPDYIPGRIRLLHPPDENPITDRPDAADLRRTREAKLAPADL